MLDKNTIVKVTNRSDGSVSYNIPDLNLVRRFAYRETKDVTVDELRKLSYIPGGEYLLRNSLVIDNEELIEELLGTVEPEYNYTEADVRNLLLNGTLDELLDCLDFAPGGVIDLVKKVAVELELNDIKKRQAILDKTHFNVTKAIEFNKETQEEEEKVAETATTRRAVTTSADIIASMKESQGGNSRRTQPPKYNVTKRGE